MPDRWVELPTVSAMLDCRPPFSFFFDVVEPYWRTNPGSAYTLHRICTLARKQGAKHLVVENAFGRDDVHDEITALDDAYGGGGAAEAIAISYFDCATFAQDITEVDPDNLLGQAIVINYRPPTDSSFIHSYVYEAILRPPRTQDGTNLLNNFISCEASFSVTVRGRGFSLAGVYYAQQNTKTSVCAHACLRMALNTLSGQRGVSNGSINSLLSITDPEAGLQLGQIERVINSVDGLRPHVIDCNAIPGAGYLSILSSIVESGDIALLVFTTGKSDIEHVVTVYGHTKNSDEWHPQAIPAYAGPSSAQYYGSASWIDHLLIHDDNFGPYFSLSARALEVEQTVKPHWIIGLHCQPRNVTPLYAEVAGSILLVNLLPSLVSLGTGRWFEYVTRNQWTYVLRTLLVRKDKYLSHLASMAAHDESTLSEQDRAHLNGLPDFFWMVEFSLPDLYTGNHSKLGEILLDAVTPMDPAKLETSLLALRIPGLLITASGQGMASVNSVNLDAHCPVFLIKPVRNRW